MNSLFNSALKQTQSLKRDLDAFSASPLTASPAIQGQISVSLSSLVRTIDDYDAMTRRELIHEKKEKAEQRIKSFRKELAEYRARFEELRGERQKAEHSVARSELLGRRVHSSATPENPYANIAHARAAASPFAPATTSSAATGNVSLSMEDHTFRERDLLSHTDVQLDEFLDRGRGVLSDLADQRNMLKNTQRRLYSVANTLGISGDTIRMIERRATQDKWFFYGGMVVFFVFCYFVLKWFS